MFVKQGVYWEVKCSVTYQIFVEMKMVQYLGISLMQTPCLGAEENMILYSIEQILIRVLHRETNILNSKQSFIGTQFPHGINHKILRKHVIITFSFSSNVIKAFKITKNIDKKLQAIYPSIFKGELMCSFERNKNLGDYLVSVKLKWNPSVGH